MKNQRLLIMNSNKDNKKSKKPYKKGDKVEISDDIRNKYGVCDHYHVDYKSLEQLNRVIFNRLLVAEEAYKNLVEHTKELKKVNDEFADQNERLVKDNFTLTRAYDGLSQMGKMAEDLGINIEEHRWRLPENEKNHDYKFKHETKLMESGKVKNIFKFKMPDSERKKFNDALIKQRKKKKDN